MTPLEKLAKAKRFDMKENPYLSVIICVRLPGCSATLKYG